MSTMQSVQYLEAIRRTLTQRTGGAPDANAVAEITINTWQQMAAQIIPVIGVGGFDVLFNRSLHLTCTAFPWLTILGDHRDRAALLANLKTRFAGRETDAAVEGSYTLLMTFIELLITLIGESLTERLLNPVWDSPSPASQQETIS